jgi:hypothetical protein
MNLKKFEKNCNFFSAAGSELDDGNQAAGFQWRFSIQKSQNLQIIRLKWSSQLCVK